jgi:hypothetical protein
MTISKDNQTISFTNLPAVVPYRINGMIPLGAKSSSGLPVVYASANTNIMRIARTNAIIRARGRVSVTATQSGNANHNAAASVVRSIEIK